MKLIETNDRTPVAMRFKDDPIIVTTPDDGRYELSITRSGDLIIHSDDDLTIIPRGTSCIELRRLVIMR